MSQGMGKYSMIGRSYCEKKGTIWRFGQEIQPEESLLIVFEYNIYNLSKTWLLSIGLIPPPSNSNHRDNVQICHGISTKTFTLHPGGGELPSQINCFIRVFLHIVQQQEQQEQEQ